MTEHAVIDSALAELDRLLASGGTSEDDLATCFATHAVIFEAYGYRRHIARPEIVFDGRTYIPSFFAERADGSWDIVELKRGGSFAEHEARCAHYASVLERPGIRHTLQKRYGCELQRDVRAVIFAGRRAHADLRPIYSLLFERHSQATFQTYDEVRTTLELHRAKLTARSPEQPGLSVHLLIVPGKLAHRPNYILDLGVATDRDRVSFFIDDDDHVCVRVIDSAGTAIVTRSSMPAAHAEYRKPIYLAFELGVAKERSLMCVAMNGVFYEERMLDAFQIDLSALGHLVVGSDVRGRAHTELRICGQMIFQSTLPFDDRAKVRRAMFDRYFAEGVEALPGAYYSGHQFMHSAGHPNFEAK